MRDYITLKLFFYKIQFTIVKISVLTYWREIDHWVE